MKFVSSLISLIILIFYSGITLGQDTILFLNGKNLILNDYKFDDDENMLLYQSKRGKLRDMDKDYIFSITNPQGVETLYYQPDSSGSRILTVPQMRRFIEGQQFAQATFKAPLACVVGFTGGLTCPLLKIRPIWYPLPTALYAVSYEVIPISLKRVKKKCGNQSEDAIFVQGYREAANKKRVNNAAIGAISGLVSSFVLAIVFREELSTLRNNIYN